MIIYEILQEFVEAVKENKITKLYISQMRNISNTGKLSGSIAICFFVGNICHMIYYDEDIPILPILTESKLQVLFSEFGKEHAEKVKAQYELAVKEFNDKMNLTEETAKKVFTAMGCSFVKAKII